ncbi:tetratricopeptide repeat protein [Hyphomonas sp.]|uniref:tetratricopeptide repeat protein n=1 Tax=Hyphomonas sp. TaxID=87 RepID=UPI003529D25E
MSYIHMARGAVVAAAMAVPVQAYADISQPASEIEHAWDHIQFEVTDRSERLAAFSELVDQADEALKQDPKNAEVMVWEAISLSSVAGEIRGPSALGKVNKARKLLLAAEEIDPNALGDGSIYSSLGTLYYQVPPFPIGFGNKKKAREFLNKALVQNPDGIETNYFMADFLVHTGDYESALKYVIIAEAAPPRPDRPVADQGRLRELEALKTKINSKLAR